MAYFSKGDYDKVIADLTESIRLDPKNAWAYSHRSLAYDKKGEKVKAKKDVERVRELGGVHVPGSVFGCRKEAKDDSHQIWAESACSDTGKYPPLAIALIPFDCFRPVPQVTRPHPFVGGPLDRPPA